MTVDMTTFLAQLGIVRIKRRELSVHQSISLPPMRILN